MTDPKKVTPWNEQLHPFVPDHQLSLPAQMARQQRRAQEVRGPAAAGGNSAAGGEFMVRLLGLALVLAATPLLYPFAAAATVLTPYGLVALGRFASFGLIMHPWVTFPLSLAVLFGAIRLEHTLGRFALYRFPRHLLRLSILSAGTIYLLDPSLIPALTDGRLDAVLADPPWKALAGTLAVAIAAHFLLFHLKRLRRWWHVVMLFFRLRPERLPLPSPS